MKKLNTIITLIFLLILSLSVSGEYKQRGNADKSYIIAETGLFNENLGTYNIYVQNLISNLMTQPPLVVDYNNDSKNEIIVADSNDIIIFQNKELNTLDSFSSNTTILSYSVFEFSNEFYIVTSEYLVAPEYNSLLVYKYNTTEWNFVGKHSTGSVFTDSMFTCDENSGYCLGVFERTDYVNGISFRLNETTSTLSNKNIRVWEGANNRLCFSSIPDVTLYNPEQDNNLEFYLSIGETSTIGGAVFDVSVEKIIINSTGEISSITTVFEREPDFNNGDGCQYYERLFTSPLIMPIDIAFPDDIAIGINEDVNEFKMHSYKLDGTNIDSYPQVLEADGTLISNPIRMTAFDNTGIHNDFCVLGYIETTGKLDLLCASEKLSGFLGFYQSYEFETSDNVTSFSIDVTTGQHIIHATQQNNELTGGVDLEEILTPYGVFKLGSFTSLDTLFQVPYLNGVSLLDDVENSGFTDYLYLTENAIVYIDDTVSNENAIIDGYSINPCIEQVWKQNTSVGISITPIDSESDTVQARAILYAEDINTTYTQDSNWSSSVASATPITFSFTADYKRTNSKITLMVRDSLTEHENLSNTVSVTFSVGDDGVSYGDCQTIVQDISLIPEDEVINEGDVGTSCSIDSDCNSGKCQGGFCVLKGGQESCSVDSQCISEKCLDGQCTKASISQNLKAVKDETFGSDSESSTIISVLIMIIVPAGIMMGSGGSAIGVILAFAVFIILGFLFAFIEWLNPFILLGVVVAVFIGFILFLIIKGRE